MQRPVSGSQMCPGLVQGAQAKKGLNSQNPKQQKSMYFYPCIQKMRIPKILSGRHHTLVRPLLACTYIAL